MICDVRQDASSWGHYYLSIYIQICRHIALLPKRQTYGPITCLGMLILRIQAGLSHWCSMLLPTGTVACPSLLSSSLYVERLSKAVHTSQRAKLKLTVVGEISIRERNRGSAIVLSNIAGLYSATVSSAAARWGQKIPLHSTPPLPLAPADSAHC